MKPVREAIVLVDAYRRPSRRRNTAGRYRVAAKTEKEAVELVRKAIGFGSIKFYYWDFGNGNSTHPKLKYKEVVEDFSYKKPKHACDPLT